MLFLAAFVHSCSTARAIDTENLHCKANQGGCQEIEPWIFVENAFQPRGFKFRTETGCYLAASWAHKQKGYDAYCFETKENAEKMFPALKIAEGVRD